MIQNSHGNQIAKYYDEFNLKANELIIDSIQRQIQFIWPEYF